MNLNSFNNDKYSGFPLFFTIGSSRHRISIYMKNIFLILVIFSISPSTSADQTQDCSLIEKRLANSPSEKNICLEIYRLCSDKAQQGNSPQLKQNQCSSQLGECQMGGALSGEALEAVMQDYLKSCKVKD